MFYYPCLACLLNHSFQMVLLAEEVGLVLKQVDQAQQSGEKSDKAEVD